MEDKKESRTALGGSQERFPSSDWIQTSAAAAGSRKYNSRKLEVQQQEAGNTTVESRKCSFPKPEVQQLKLIVQPKARSAAVARSKPEAKNAATQCPSFSRKAEVQ